MAVVPPLTLVKNYKFKRGDLVQVIATQLTGTAQYVGPDGYLLVHLDNGKSKEFHDSELNLIAP